MPHVLLGSYLLARKNHMVVRLLWRFETKSVLKNEEKKALFSGNACRYVEKNANVISKTVAIIDEILENI